jgi:hypothetical protein
VKEYSRVPGAGSGVPKGVIPSAKICVVKFTTKFAAVVGW